MKVHKTVYYPLLSQLLWSMVRLQILPILVI